MAARRSPIVDIDLTTIDAVLKRVQIVALPEDFKILDAAVKVLVEADDILRVGRSQYRRMRRLFGYAMSEKTSDVLARMAATAAAQAAAEHAAGTAPASGPTGTSSFWDDSTIR